MVLLLLPLLHAADAPLLPLTQHARVDGSVATATVSGGVVANDTAAVDGAVRIEGNVAERVAVAVDVGLAAEGVALGGGARLAILRQADAGIDLALGARYKHVGWNSEAVEVGEFETTTSVGHAWEGVEAVLNATFGAAVGGREKDAELAGAALAGVAEGLSVGGDARLRVSLVDEGEEPGEEEWQEDGRRLDLVAGPVLNVAAGPVIAMAQVGGSLVVDRAGDRVPGAVVNAGLKVGF